MTADADWTTCTVDGLSVELRTRTSFEVERADELMDESAILSDVLSELRQDDVFLDVGANVGLYTLFAAASGAEAVAVEPHPANLESLTANLERNDITATVIRGALADRAGHAELYEAAEEAGAGTHTFAPDQVSETTRTVQTYAGDELIEAGDMPQPSVAKLDVQGAEYQVLQGLEEALTDSAFRTIYCEVHPEQIEKIGGSAEALESLLTDHGFELETLVDKADVTWNIKATR